MAHEDDAMVENRTNIGECVLLGFTKNHQVEMMLFAISLIMYLMAISGNLLIITLTLIDLQTISYVGCLSQSFLYFFLGTTDFFLLTVMSFDRYVAICNPLRYTSIMSDRFCTLLVLISWIGGFALIFAPFMLLIQFPFCGSNIIDHFFCDIRPLLILLCGDTRLLQLIGFLLAVFSLLGTLALTVMSYTKIISTILRIPSAAGRQKAFSTCAAHITVVSITYGSCISMYVKPVQSDDHNLSKAMSVLNNVVCPLMTPFVYSLRNKQVQDALKSAFNCKVAFHKIQRTSQALKVDTA